MTGVCAAESILKDELCCSVCLAIFRDPVSLDCGHCFCRECINTTLCHQSDQGRSYTCPMCQADYEDFPSLLKNLQLSSILDNYRSMQKNSEDCQIPCGDCLDHPNTAVKLCISCEVSLCQKHLKRHIEKRHTILEPTASVKDRKCSKHDKLLEYYCEKDNSCICVTCYIAGSHKGHTILTLKKAHKKQLVTLTATTSTLSASVSALCKDVEGLHAGLAKIKENAVKLSKPLEELCDNITLLVKEQFKEIAQAVNTNQAQTTSEITAQIKQVEDAKEKTEKALKELNILSKQPDDLLFVQCFNKSQALIAQQSLQINTLQVVDIEADKVMIENVEKETKDYIAIISQHLKYVHDILSQQKVQNVMSGGQRKMKKNANKKVLRIKCNKSQKMNLTFDTLSFSHCSYTATISATFQTITCTKPPNVHPHAYSSYGYGYNRQYSVPSESQCYCMFPVVISKPIERDSSSNKVHCLVDVSKSNNWCVGISDDSSSVLKFLQWNGNDLSYNSETSLSLGHHNINRLKMELDYESNLLGFYEIDHEKETPLLICRCDDMFRYPILVGFNVSDLDGSLTLI